MAEKIPIGLQLYSVRRDAAEDLLGVIDKVAAMGYQGVEFAGYHGVGAADLRAALDRNGIVCCGTHIGMGELLPEKAAATEEFHNTIGCKWLIIPWIPEEKRNSPEACAQTAKELTELCAYWEPRGFRVGFHAHDGDMRPLSDGKSAWDHLASGTPSTFILQYDTANGMSGGADPVEPIKNWPGRNASVHLKGYKGGHGHVIGEDAIPWSDVFAAAESVGGVQWYVVEHEAEDVPPLESVDKCLKNLRAMGK